MNVTKKGWVIVGIAGCLMGLMLFAYFTREVREQKLKDGSILRIEKIYYGKPEPYDYRGMLDRLMDRVPQALRARFIKPPKPGVGQSSWYDWATVHTNEDALYVYITRRDPDTGAYQPVDVRWARVLDEHGCVFMSTQAGGSDDGRVSGMRGRMGSSSSVNWFRFEAFPRHERKFRLQFSALMQTNIEADFLVRNPAPESPPKKWTVEPLPITKTEGGVSFVLDEVKLQADHSKWSGNHFSPEQSLKRTVRVLENGQPSTNWEALETELYDISGNFSGSPWGPEPILCPQEDAWKLRIKYYATEQSTGASNVVWAVRGIRVPADGEFTNLDLSRELGGSIVDLVAFAGRGEYVYSNTRQKLLKGSPSQETLKENRGDYTSNSQFVVHGKTPHLSFSLAPLTEDQRFTVRAVDDHGREFYGYEWPMWSRYYQDQQKTNHVHYLQKSLYPNREQVTVIFALPPDAKKVDLFFCVHNCRIPEFIFKPPTVKNAATSPAKD